MKQTAQRIFRQTLAAIDIQAALQRKLARTGPLIHAAGAEFDLGRFQKILAIAYGKAAFLMAEGLGHALAPDFEPEGILVVPAEPPRPLQGWQTFVSSHPVPNSQSFSAGRAILDRLATCDEATLVFFLISGGASSLVEQPLDPAASLRDFQKLHSALIGCGASISEVNTVRKHLSATKGGRLAVAARRSVKLTFAISDVPFAQESALASGSTLPDPSTIADAERIVRDYNLLDKFPASLRTNFERHSLEETPKEGDPGFANAHFEILLGAHDLLHAAHRACEAQGFLCLCDTSTDHWSIEKASDHLLGILYAHKRAHPGKAVAVLADGEVSSPVTGDGLGGRNSAFVLACVAKIAGKDITVLSAGTDGIDGNSPAAGAVADGRTSSRALAAGMNVTDFLDRSDAYSVFSRLGDTVVTGLTGNNLRDLRIFLMT